MQVVNGHYQSILSKARNGKEFIMNVKLDTVVLFETWVDYETKEEDPKTSTMMTANSPRNHHMMISMKDLGKMLPPNFYRLHRAVGRDIFVNNNYIAYFRKYIDSRDPYAVTWIGLSNGLPEEMMHSVIVREDIMPNVQPEPLPDNIVQE